LTARTILANKSSHGEYGNCHCMEYYMEGVATECGPGGALRRTQASGLDTPGWRGTLLLGLMADLTRSKRELLAENALLRQHLIAARRQFKRPKLRPVPRHYRVCTENQALGTEGSPDAFS